MSGYDATMTLADERPDLLPLLHLILDMGAKAFSEGLEELAQRGLLEVVEFGDGTYATRIHGTNMWALREALPYPENGA